MDSYSPDKYVQEAIRTINRDISDDDRLMHSLLGMGSEAGEILGLFQKTYQGHEIDLVHVQKELGDLMWFVAEFCYELNFSLEDVMKMNIAKLRKRFPEGFSEDRSLHRADGDI